MIWRMKRMVNSNSFIVCRNWDIMYCGVVLPLRPPCVTRGVRIDQYTGQPIYGRAETIISICGPITLCVHLKIILRPAQQFEFDIPA